MFSLEKQKLYIDFAHSLLVVEIKTYNSPNKNYIGSIPEECFPLVCISSLSKWTAASISSWPVRNTRISPVDSYGEIAQTKSTITELSASKIEWIG